MTESINIHKYQKGVIGSGESSYAAETAYAAMVEDVRQGKISVGDIVIFDWEDGRRNIVKSLDADGKGRVWIAEIADEIAA